MFDHLIDLFLKSMKLDETQIDAIRGNLSKEDAYKMGLFCNHCSAFESCGNPPALKERARKGQPAPVAFKPQQNKGAGLAELLLILALLDSFEANGISGGSVGTIAPTPNERDEPIPEEFAEFFKKLNNLDP